MITKKWHRSSLFLIIISLGVCYYGYKEIVHPKVNQAISLSSTHLVPASDMKYITVKVASVVDGDTIHVVLHNKKETVRLILINAPETQHPSKPIEPFGPEATRYMEELLTGKQVKLEQDRSLRDQYGRLLMYVWLEDRMVNEMLLEKGLARVSVFPPDVKYVEAFRIVQKKAQQARLGIWSQGQY
jgi:micrococcal nuclease